MKTNGVLMFVLITLTSSFGLIAGFGRENENPCCFSYRMEEVKFCSE